MPFEHACEPLITQYRQMQAAGATQKDLTDIRNQIQQQKIELYQKLSAWDVCHIARHPDRPHAPDVIQAITSTFVPLSGTRSAPDDPSVICGLAQIGHSRAIICAQDKGRTPEEKNACHFGMSSPAGFRKALRAAQLAEKFQIPLITIIDTPGALPTVDAESSNQSEAIARNIFAFSALRTPIISIILGEGMSGGALALAVCDSIAMCEYAVFSVISPEGCAAILWKDRAQAEQAANAMHITAPALAQHGFIDHIISEPTLGAHTDPAMVCEGIKQYILQSLEAYQDMNSDELIAQRRKRYEHMG